MTLTNPYERLLEDPVWGPEVKTLCDLPECESTDPVLVGGAVRDLLLGRPISDLDIATAKPDTAHDLAEVFALATGRRLVEYSHEQTIHRVVSRDSPQVDFTDPEGGNRDADLRRRDFTVNAMALGVVGDVRGKIIDPTGGLNDLKSKIVRMTSPVVFDSDPLRLLRAFRFSAQLGFEIDANTYEEISSRGLLLRGVAGERIQIELLQLLEPEGVADRVAKMDETGLLWPLFPELAMQKNFMQNEYHHLDVWSHTLEALRQIERILRVEEDVLKPYADRIREYIDTEFPSGHTRRSLIKLATLLHDIAKPHCKGVREDGRITFIGHERKGADLCMEHFDRLKFPGYEKDFVCRIIQGHLRPGAISQACIERPKVAYRFFRDYDDASVAIILMSLADRLSAQGEKVTDDVNERHRETVAYLLDCLYNRTELVVRPRQLVDGASLMHDLGLKPGPMIGHLLKRVQEAQVMGEVSSREEAIDFCRSIVEQ